MPPAERPLLIVAYLALLGAFAFLLWAAADVLLLVFGGVLLTVLLRGLSTPLNALTGIGEGVSLALVLVLLAGALSVGGWFLGAELANQLDQLIPRVQATWQAAQEHLYRYEWGRRFLTDGGLGELSPENAGWLARITGGIFSTTAGTVAGLLIAVFIGLYGAAAPQTYRRGLLQLIPGPRRQRAGEVLDAAGTTLRWWLIGTLVRMTVVGIATTAGLALLDIPLALALGLIAFLFEFVPYLGPVLAAVPALLVALTVGPVETAWVALLYLGVQAAENYIFTPLIDQRSVHLPPALAITAQVLLGTSLGTLGVVFAIPLTALGMVLVRMLYIEDTLGEAPPARAAGPPGMARRPP